MPSAVPPDGKLICVCMKAVWRTDVRLRLDSGSRGVRPEESLMAANPADLAALQIALGVRARFQGIRVLALTLAPEGAAFPLRDALAAGADEILRVWSSDWQAQSGSIDAGSDGTRARAEAVATVLRARSPDLILTGERSADAGHECFGGFLAAALGASFAHRAATVERDPAGWRVVVRLERGYRQPVALASPAVVTVSAQGGPPEKASLPGWMASRLAAIPVEDPDTASPRPTSTQLRIPVPRVKRFKAPASGLTAEQRIQAMITLDAGPGGTVLAGESPQAQADAALRVLHERGYL